MNVNGDVREQLILSRWLLTEPNWQGSAVPESVRVQHDLIVAHGATELAVAAICVELDCLPDKKNPCLLDYFNSLTKAVPLASSEPGADYIAELHTARSASQLRFRPPDPGRWTRPNEEALKYITRWCQQCLGLSLMDLDSAPTESLAARAPIEQPKIPLGHTAPRYNCVGSADIRLVFQGQSETGAIDNLSVGGCYVRSALVPEVGDQVEMILQVNKMSFRIGGKVIHVLPLRVAGKERGNYSGIGIQFKEMSAGARDRLQDLIAEFRMKTNRRWDNRRATLASGNVGVS